MEDKKIICDKLKELYKNVCLDDVFIQAKEDYLNPDIEDAVYLNLTPENVYDILNDKVLLDKNIIPDMKAIILSLNEGYFAMLLYLMFNLKKVVCIENMYEFYSLFNEYFKIFYKTNKKPNINVELYHKQLLKAKLQDKDLIILNYNNTNKYYWDMMENKIIDEAKNGATIVKTLTPFKQNISLKLIKIKKVTNNNKNLLVFYYKKY